MVPVTVTVDATDLCDPNFSCEIISVTSNEPVNGVGDGDTSPDWIITGPLDVRSPRRAFRDRHRPDLYDHRPVHGPFGQQLNGDSGCDRAAFAGVSVECE